MIDHINFFRWFALTISIVQGGFLFLKDHVDKKEKNNEIKNLKSLREYDAKR